MRPDVDQEDWGEFNDKVDEAARLIAGLKEGTISPEYVDKKVDDRIQKESAVREKREEEAKQNELTPERQEELKRKVAEIKDRHARKERARQKFIQYIEEHPTSGQTDYHKWDMWCPSDDEDDLIRGCTPNSPEFKAMEKDIDERHQRMVKHRQIAEREKANGNEAYKRGQVMEAYRCYVSGLDAEKHNMELHANAALASIKMDCHMQAIEHCDKVLHIADAFHGKPKHPLCVKVLLRRAAANKGLQHYADAVEDLEKAGKIDPSCNEVKKQLVNAKRDLEEHRNEKDVLRRVENCDDGKGVTRFARVRDLLKQLDDIGRKPHDATSVHEATPRGMGCSLQSKFLPKSRQEDGLLGRLQELRDLLASDVNLNVYFRECRGVQILGNQLDSLAVKASNEVVVIAQIVSLVIKTPKILEEIISSRILCKIVELFVNVKISEEARLELLRILHTVTAAEGGNKLICVALGEHFDDMCGYERLIETFSKSSYSEKILSSLTLANSMHEAPARSFFKSSNGSTLKLCRTLEKSLRSIDSAEKQAALTLLSSLTGDKTLRFRLTQSISLMKSLLSTACQTGLPDSCLYPCLAALANLLSEPAVMGLIDKWDSQLICILTSSVSHRDLKIVAASTLALSRITKAPNMLPALMEAGTIEALVSALEADEKDEKEDSSLQTSVKDAALIALAAVSTHGRSSIDFLVRSGVVHNIVKILRTAEKDGGVCGNASLLLSNVANYAEHAALLNTNDCIKALIDVAHKSGPTSRRNAAIALAKIAQNPGGVEKIRQLHGFEVMYHYVKP